MNTFLLILKICFVPFWTLLGWLVVLVIHAMWGRRLFWYKGTLTTVLKQDSWPVNRDKFAGGWWLRKYTLADGTVVYRPWGGTTLMPYAVMLSEGGMNTVTMEHELRHVRQAVHRGIAMTALAIPIGLVGPWWLGLLVYLIGPGSLLLWGPSTFVESWLNRGEGYRDNIYEQHARGVKEHVNYHRLDDVLDGKVDMEDIYKKDAKGNPQTRIIS